MKKKVAAALAALLALSAVGSGALLAPASAGTQAPLEPTYPLPATSALWTSPDGKFKLQGTRVNDGAACYLSNGAAKGYNNAGGTTAQWIADAGGDGGNGDGRVCHPGINTAPGDSTLTYRVDWSVDASAGPVTREVVLPRGLDSTSVNTFCASDPAGRWTAKSSGGNGCTFTYAAGATYAGAWTLNYDTSSLGDSSIVKVGYNTPQVTVDRAQVDLPSFTLLNTPAPFFATTTGTPAFQWVSKNGVTYAEWRVSASNYSKGALNDRYDIKFDTSSLPAGSIVSGGIISVPRSALPAASGSFELPLSNYTTTAAYTSLEPYAGILPFVGYGQPVDYDTPSFNGVGGTPNHTWARISWDQATYKPANYSKSMSPNSIRPLGATTARITITPNEFPFTPPVICDEFSTAYSQLDKTRAAYLEVGTQQVPVEVSEAVGKNCSGSNSATTTALSVSKLPALSQAATLVLPIRNAKASSTHADYIRDTAYAGGTKEAESFYTALPLQASMSLESSAQASVVAGNKVSDKARVNGIFWNPLKEDAPLTSTRSGDFTLSSCAQDPTFDMKFAPNGKVEVVQQPDLGPDGLACTADDKDPWVFRLSSTETVSSIVGATQSFQSLFDLTYSTPPWAAVGTRLPLEAVRNSEKLSSTPEVSPTFRFATTYGSASTTVVNANVVGQEVQRDSEREEVGTRIGWNLIGFNGTDASGTAAFTWEVDPRTATLSDFKLSAFGQASLSMVSVSFDGVTYQPYDPASGSVPKLIRMTVDSFSKGWVGNLRVSAATEGSSHNSEAAVRALEGVTSLSNLKVPPIDWKPVTLYTLHPSVSLSKTASLPFVSRVGEVVTYKFVVKNDGFVPLSGVRVEDPLPGLSAVACPKTELAVEEAMTCEASYSVSEGDLSRPQLLNTAAVLGSSPKGEEVSSTSSAVVAVASRPETPYRSVVFESGI